MSQAKLNVSVTYPAAQKPFQDHDASGQETLSDLKARVLNAFGLKEGVEDGNQITYVFFRAKERLTDLSVTLGALAGQANALVLKLSQQIEQGS